MVKDFPQILSDSSKRMKRSAIRELLKLTNKPGLISFAGGLPSPLTFPIEELKEITAEILDTDSTSALQYSTTEGDPLLRKLLTERYVKNGTYRWTQMDTDNNKLFGSGYAGSGVLRWNIKTL